jgi:hypothetical protein
VPAFDIDDVPVKFEHIVLIVKVDVDLLYFSVKGSEFSNETQRGEDEETGCAHQHERCHDEMDGKEEYNGKDVFEYAVFEPSETQGFGEEDMLQVPHIACGEEKKFVIQFKNMVFPGFGYLPFGKYIKYGVYFGGTVDLGNHIERAGRVEDEHRLFLKAVKLGKYTSYGTVTAIDDDITVLLDIVVFRQGREIDGGDVEMRMRNGFSDREYLHECP